MSDHNKGWSRLPEWARGPTGILPKAGDLVYITRGAGEDHQWLVGHVMRAELVEPDAFKVWLEDADERLITPHDRISVISPEHYVHSPRF